MNTTAIGPPRPHFERQGSAPPSTGITGAASGGDLTKGLKLEKGPSRSKQVTSASASTFVSTSEPAWSARSSFESTKTDVSSSKNNDQHERRDHNRSHLLGDLKSSQTYSHGRLERPLLSSQSCFDPLIDVGPLEKLQLAGDSPWLEERDSVLDRTPTRSSLESGCAGDCGGSYLPSSELNVVLGEAYGAHFVPGTQNEAGTVHRSSLDLLLTAPQVLTMNGSRHSLDSLQEMFINRSHGKTTLSVGQLAKAMPTAAQRLLRVGDSSQGSVQCAMNASSPVSSPSKIAFSKPKRSLADTSITVIAQPTTVNAGAMSSSANSGASVGALASAVVDQSTAVTRPRESFFEDKDCLEENCFSKDEGDDEQRWVLAEASSSTTHSPTPLARSPPRPKPAMSDKDSAKNTASSAVSYPGTGLVDADLHDTFGAHAWYLGPAGRHLPASKATGSTSPRPPKFSKMLEPTTVAGQHSVTLHDAQSTVPSYDYLRQLRTVKEKQKKANGIGQGSGYIAEAKRVLNEAMANDASRKRMSPSNAIEGQQESSYSGAIGPLLRLVTAGLEAKEDEKVRGALHTLSLLVTNLPNRGILCDLGGRSVLMGVIRDERAALDCREWAVQLLWDLEPEVKRPYLLGRQCAAMLRSEDAMSLLEVLAETGEARIASHILHFLHVAFVERVWDARPVSPAGGEPASREEDQNREQSEDEKLIGMTASQKSFVAESIVREVCAHKHHLYDAAQYTVGELLGSVLEDDDVPDHTVSSAIAAVLRALDECFDYVQCQILLTVLSCVAGRRRLRKELEKDASRRVIHAYVRRVQDSDQRLRARALSLVKVAGGMGEEEEASREDHRMFIGTWYFGPDDG